MAQQRGSSRGGSSKKRRSDSDDEGSNQVLIGLAVGGGFAALIAVIALLVFNRGGNTPPAPAAPVVAQSDAPATMPMQAPMTAPVPAPIYPSPVMTSPTAPHDAVASIPSQVATSPTDSPAVIPSQIAHSAGTPTPSPSMTSPSSSTPTADMDLPDLISAVDPSIVRLNVKTNEGPSIGSGFVVSESGIVVTNYHVIEGGREVTVEFEDKRKASVLGFKLFDEARDIAILQLDPSDAPFKAVRLATEQPRKGIKVAAFGAPLGLSFTATEGTVSNIRSGKELGMEGNYIQTDTPISPGNSGGPLVMMNGTVVGMNTFQFTQGQNLNFAVSVDDIREVLEASKSKQLQPITPTTVPSRRIRTPKFVDITGTERADKLLAQINAPGVIVLPFPIDPTGRINDFMIDKLTKTLKSRLKMELTRIHELKVDQPLIVMSVSFDLPEDEKLKERLASQLSVEIYVVMLDLDKDGNRNPSMVWKEKSKLAVLSINALANGNIPKSVIEKSQEFFNKFSQAIVKAKKEHASL